GFQAEFVPSTNPAWGEHLVLTRPGSSQRSLAMVSHLDTVFPPEEEARNNFHWQPEGDRIYGPGTHDIKGGTVMMWPVLSAQRARRSCWRQTSARSQRHRAAWPHLAKNRRPDRLWARPYVQCRDRLRRDGSESGSPPSYGRRGIPRLHSRGLRPRESCFAGAG